MLRGKKSKLKSVSPKETILNTFGLHKGRVTSQSD